MSPRFTVSILDAAAPGGTPATLTFHAKGKIGQRQKRHLDRVRLEPEIDLRRYRCRAVLDFVELTIQTGRPTQFRYVQECVKAVWNKGVPYVTTVSENQSAATEFRIRLQEPQVWDLRNIEHALQRKFDLVRPAVVSAVEVSVDFHAIDASYNDRVRMVALLQRLFRPRRDVWKDKSLRPRMIYSKEGKTQIDFLLPSVSGNPDVLDVKTLFEPSRVRQLRADATLYIGQKSGDPQVRIQNKISDRRTGDNATPLPDEECRARIEVTLTRKELADRGVYMLEDLELMNFGSLQGDFFHFALPTFPSSLGTGISPKLNAYLNRTRYDHFFRGGILAQERAEALRDDWFQEPTALLGGRSRYQQMKSNLRAAGIVKERVRVGRGILGHSVAYTPLNAMVHSALRELTRRERRQLGRKV